MTAAAFRELCKAHHAAQTACGSARREFSASEQFAFDLYKQVRERTNSPIRAVLETVLTPQQTQSAIDVVRARIDVASISGTCEPEWMDEWRNVESTLVALHELLTGHNERR